MAIVEPGKGRSFIEDVRAGLRRADTSMPIVVPDNEKVSVHDDGVLLRITMRVIAPPFIPVIHGLFVLTLVYAEISGIIALRNGGPRSGEHF